MDNLSAVQIGQPVQHTLCNLAQDLFTGPASQLLHFLVDTIETSTFAEFHGN